MEDSATPRYVMGIPAKVSSDVYIKLKSMSDKKVVNCHWEIMKSKTKVTPDARLNILHWIGSQWCIAYQSSCPFSHALLESLHSTWHFKVPASKAIYISFYISIKVPGAAEYLACKDSFPSRWQNKVKTNRFRIWWIPLLFLYNFFSNKLINASVYFLTWRLSYSIELVVDI